MPILAQPTATSMDSFYKLPENIASPLIKHSFIEGKILCPLDHGKMLGDQLRSHRLNVDSNTSIENYTNTEWWAEQRSKNYDWVVASTGGLKDLTSYILKYGMAVAANGVAILDRLSFLEPVKTRRDFLFSNKLSNLIVLSPRPTFHQLGGAKDSVTSAWLVFQHSGRWQDGCMMAYALNWGELAQLPELPIS